MSCHVMLSPSIKYSAGGEEVLIILFFEGGGERWALIRKARSFEGKVLNGGFVV